MSIFITSITSYWVIFMCSTVARSTNAPQLPPIENLEKIPIKGSPLPPCRVCRALVKSFLNAVQETSRGTFDGGDALWEEKRLGHYADSEVRFIEIQEKLCSDVARGKDQCHILAELHEAELEDWFYVKRKQNADLLDILCINHLRICCPDNMFGTSCEPCPGGSISPCNGHGRCEGGGTREGPGTCFCDAGYLGELCDQCEAGYYKDANVSEISCKICNKACKNHCRGPGPQNCEICAFGYRHESNLGCVEHYDDYETLDEMEEKIESNETKNSKNDGIDFNSADLQDSQHTEL